MTEIPKDTIEVEAAQAETPAVPETAPAEAPVQGRHAKVIKPVYKPETASAGKVPYTPGTAQVTRASAKDALRDASSVAGSDDAEGTDRPALASVSEIQPSQTAQLTATLPTLDLNAVSAPQGRPIITLSHVTKIYPAQPDKPALNDVSVQIYAGEFIFLVGHSGSGKSTFIRMLTREIKPTSGHIYIADEDLTKMRNWRVPYLRRNVGCVFQDFKLLPNKTVFENVAFALEVIGKSRHVIKTQVPEVLRLVGLQEKMHKMPDQLSGGEQQRVSIARAIVNRPPLLICDEPTGNLDPQTSRGIMDLLERINRTGTTVLVATHDREMVDNMRRRVIALDHGKLTRDQDRGVYGFDA